MFFQTLGFTPVTFADKSPDFSLLIVTSWSSRWKFTTNSINRSSSVLQSSPIRNPTDTKSGYSFYPPSRSRWGVCVKFAPHTVLNSLEATVVLMSKLHAIEFECEKLKRDRNQFYRRSPGLATVSNSRHIKSLMYTPIASPECVLLLSYFSHVISTQMSK